MSKELIAERRRLELKDQINYLTKSINYSEKEKTNMDVTIKDATNSELEAILRRLELEDRVQRVVGSIKRRTLTKEEREYYDDQISTEVPVSELYHYGIKGMRWGVRRDRKAKSSNKSTSSSTETSEDHKTTRSLKSKGTKSLSNAELKKVNERLQLEKTYASLNPKKVSLGKKIVSGLAKETVKMVSSTARVQVQKQVHKRLGSKIDANINKLLDGKKG